MGEKEHRDDPTMEIALDEVGAEGLGPSASPSGRPPPLPGSKAPPPLPGKPVASEAADSRRRTEPPPSAAPEGGAETPPARLGRTIAPPPVMGTIPRGAAKETPRTLRTTMKLRKQPPAPGKKPDAASASAKPAPVRGGGEPPPATKAASAKAAPSSAPARPASPSSPPPKRAASTPAPRPALASRPPRAGSGSSASSSATSSATETRLRLLEERVKKLAARPDPSAALAALERRVQALEEGDELGALARRVDTLEQRRSSGDTSLASRLALLEARVDDVTEQVDTLPPPASLPTAPLPTAPPAEVDAPTAEVDTGAAEALATLATQVEALARADALEALASRVEALEAPREPTPEGEALEALVARVAALEAGPGEHDDERGAEPHALEARLAALEEGELGGRVASLEARLVSMAARVADLRAGASLPPPPPVGASDRLAALEARLDTLAPPPLPAAAAVPGGPDLEARVREMEAKLGAFPQEELVARLAALEARLAAAADASPPRAAAAPGARPLTDVKGVGPATAEKLREAGAASAADLVAWTEADVARAASATGLSEKRLRRFQRAAAELAG